MELRQYWNIVRRRWPLLVIPAAVVLALGLATYQPPAPIFNTGVRFIVGQAPAQVIDPTDYERYHNWLASEYIVNALTSWVLGGDFADRVSIYLAEQGIEVPASAIQQGLASDNQRSMLTVWLTTNDGERLPAMMAGVITILKEDNAEALPQLGGEPATLVLMDEPVVNQVPNSIREQLDLPLRLLLALAAGVGLVLLAEYLDPTIRDRQELEALGLQLLGEIPKR